MSNYVGRKVSYAKVHTLVFLVNVGQMGPVLDDQTNRANGGVQMTRIPEGILLTGKNKFGQPFEAIIESANVAYSQLEPEAK